MTMRLLTLFQILGTLFAYLFVTMAIPWVLCRKRLSRYRYAYRVLFYFIVGNFYATNLVFVLELLHIANFFTLWIGLTVLPVTLWCWLTHYPLLKKLRPVGDVFRRLLTGSLGFRSAIRRLFRWIRQTIARVIRAAWRNFRIHFLEWLLTAVVVMMVLWVYGIRAVTSYGYSASDIPVHLYWTNELFNNNLFVAGVYPEGMHAIAYVLSCGFGIDTYVIYRVFAIIQCLAIHMMGLVFLKLCCKSKFAPYIGVFLYSVGDYITFNNLSRYLSTLPQEFSMVFVLPTAYYALAFFAEKRREMKEELPGDGSKLALAGLVMSFSLSVTAHFYGAIIAGLFCVGIGMGHLGWLVRPVYLKRIVIAALVSLLIAVLPMGIAYATGTPLQGSLFWATSMMSSGQSQTEATETTESTEQATQPTEDPVLTAPTEAESTQTPTPEQEAPEAPGFLEKVEGAVLKVWNAIGGRLKTYVLRNSKSWYSDVTQGLILLLMLAGAFALLFPSTRCYGAMLLSTGIFMAIMSAMLAATAIGIPALMGADRTCIFYAYMLMLPLSLAVDALTYGISRLLRGRWLKQVLSFAAAVAVLICIWQQGRIRQPLASDGLEMNEAIACLTNIIATERDYTWTIFSANDETNMVFGHGYHYELSTFLRQIRIINGFPVTVPTETVYFFIEKIPLDYTVSYEDSGQSVSAEGAQQTLPNMQGLGNYEGRNRWIIMSHMYYWAQAFQKLYPNEMTVYLETDRFICYRLEQNTYSLYDLGIDYGYNISLLEEE